MNTKTYAGALSLGQLFSFYKNRGLRYRVDQITLSHIYFSVQTAADHNQFRVHLAAEVYTQDQPNTPTPVDYKEILARLLCLVEEHLDTDHPDIEKVIDEAYESLK